MRAVVQRVSQASVSVDGEITGQIGRGVVVLVGVTHGDTEEQADWLAQKIAGLRIFEDREGKMNAGLLDLEEGGAALVISQFTLYADARQGRRPSFTNAAPPEVAEPLVAHFAQALRSHDVPVETGVFGAYMMVEIHNDGPVTILLER
jgi:D-tyrosyl-tRNA(Tyr) deacylase